MSNKSKMPDDHDDRHKYIPFLRGSLITPFMIYVRCHNALSDQDFMKMFGLQNYYKASPPLDILGSYVVFANDSEWTHIADDVRYTLWHSPKTAEAIAELSRDYDVFRNSIGDIDESFEFEYYQDGKLVRKFVFEHDVFKKSEIVTEDYGIKLQGEPETFSSLQSSAQKMFPTITQALGIVRVTDPFKNRFYCKRAEDQ